jgi:hypothetical protein
VLRACSPPARIDSRIKLSTVYVIQAGNAGEHKAVVIESVLLRLLPAKVGRVKG